MKEGLVLLEVVLCLAIGIPDGIPIAKAESLYPDLSTISQDLSPPPLSEGNPQPGVRVRRTLKSYSGSDVHHTLYLPVNWTPSSKFPVLVEYPGNGPYENQYGDVCTGQVEDCVLGY